MIRFSSWENVESLPFPSGIKTPTFADDATNNIPAALNLWGTGNFDKRARP